MVAVNNYISDRFFQKFPISLFDVSEKQWTFRVMEAVKPYFLSAYREGTHWDRAIKPIQGVWYEVERFNHGLAHGLRQGALAKDIFDYLVQMPDEGALFKWVRTKSADPHFLKKLEMASSFQRSGREQEGGSSVIPALYKKYELQDAVNFRKAALESGIFSSASEIQVFEEAILWSNKGTLDENANEDLKYLRGILHTAHTLDLRRIITFDAERIKNDAFDQLFGAGSDPRYRKIIESLWNRSGEYIQATGDRDLVHQRGLQDTFFLQSSDPIQMVDAIDRIRNISLLNGFFDRK